MLADTTSVEACGYNTRMSSTPRPDYLRPFRLIIGAVLLAAGLAILPLPVPAGALLAVIGLALLIRDSEYVRERFIRLRARFPWASDRMTSFGGRLPSSLRGLIDSTDPNNHRR